MDASSLGKGMGYEALPESYVIFIDEHDALGMGKALYEVERMDRDGCEPYGDGSHIVHVSASLADEGTDLGKLMHDLRCTDPGKMYYTGLRERTSYFKETEEGKGKMSDVFERLYENGLAEGIAKGIKKGTRDTAMNNARSMIRDGSIPLEKVAEFSGLSLDEVEKLKSGISL